MRVTTQTAFLRLQPRVSTRQVTGTSTREMQVERPAKKMASMNRKKKIMPPDSVLKILGRDWKIRPLPARGSRPNRTTAGMHAKPLMTHSSS